MRVYPNRITQGQKAELTWNAQHAAEGVSLEPGFAAVEPVGSRIVSPDRTTEYRLTASNGSCATTTTDTLTVDALKEIPGALFDFIAMPDRPIYEGLVICQGTWGDGTIAGEIKRIHVPLGTGDIRFLRPIRDTQNWEKILDVSDGITITDLHLLTSDRKSIPLVYATNSKAKTEFVLTLDYTDRA